MVQPRWGSVQGVFSKSEGHLVPHKIKLKRWRQCAIHDVDHSPPGIERSQQGNALKSTLLWAIDIVQAQLGPSYAGLSKTAGRLRAPAWSWLSSRGPTSLFFESEFHVDKTLNHLSLGEIIIIGDTIFILQKSCDCIWSSETPQEVKFIREQF